MSVRAARRRAAWEKRKFVMIEEELEEFRQRQKIVAKE